MTVNVFGNYDSIVHQNPHHNDHPKKGNHVDGDAIRRTDNEQSQKGKRNTKCNPSRESEIEEKSEKQQDQDQAHDAIAREQIDPIIEHGIEFVVNIEAVFAVFFVEFFLIRPKFLRDFRDVLIGCFLNLKLNRGIAIVF